MAGMPTSGPQDQPVEPSATPTVFVTAASRSARRPTRSCSPRGCAPTRPPVSGSRPTPAMRHWPSGPRSGLPQTWAVPPQPRPAPSRRCERTSCRGSPTGSWSRSPASTSSGWPTRSSSPPDYRGCDHALASGCRLPRSVEPSMSRGLGNVTGPKSAAASSNRPWATAVASNTVYPHPPAAAHRPKTPHRPQPSKRLHDRPAQATPTTRCATSPVNVYIQDWLHGRPCSLWTAPRPAHRGDDGRHARGRGPSSTIRSRVNGSVRAR